jgi:acyl-CoA synthetase (AMP-forming)/AMP-acid ligase II
VRVVDADGFDVGAGGTGEILTRGSNVFAGYWNREEATREVFVDGWFRTGDIASVDDEGYLLLRDRAKDMYISGGENVYPAEVESALLEIPGVAEAAVIGVSDERWGEVGRAFIVLSGDSKPRPPLDLDAIHARFEGRLAHYKFPRSLVILESLPRNSTGKLLKHVLREKKD